MSHDPRWNPHARQQWPPQQASHLRPHPGQAPPQALPPGHQPPRQVVYPASRLGPTVTQEMRQRAAIRQPAPAQGPDAGDQWTTMAMVRRAEKPTWTGTRIVGLIGVILLGLLFLGIMIVLFLVFGALNFLLIILAGLPLVMVLGIVLLIDRWRPQSPMVIALCLLWGAAASVVMTLALGVGDDVARALIGRGEASAFMGAVIHAPLFEESTKCALLLIIFLAARKHFDGPLQGFIFGSLIGAGFAFTENILYLGSGAAEGGAAGLAGIFFVRAIMSPIGHELYTGAAGMLLGFGARRPGVGLGIGLFFVGLIIAMILHGLWNLIPTLGAASGTEDGALVSLLFSALLAFLMLVTWLTSAFVLRRSDVVRARQAMGDYANAGWLHHAEVDMFGSWAGRRRARAWAARIIPEGPAIMRRMIRISALLSVLRHRILLDPRATAKDQAQEQELLGEFVRLRGSLLRRSGMPV